MKWWADFWGPPEKRNFTQAVIGGLHGYHSGGADAAGIAAVEFAAGLIGRSLAVAEVSGNSIAAVASITPVFLQSVGRALIRQGEIVFGISASRRGEIRLTPAAHWDIQGLPDPRSWWYTLSFNRPSGDRIKLYPATACSHFKNASDPAREWRGLSPLALCSETAELAANLEAKLAEETGAPTGNLLPVPTDGDDENLASLKRDLAGIGGKHLLIETVAGGWSEGRGAAPSADWKSRRIGAAPPRRSPGFAIRDRASGHSCVWHSPWPGRSRIRWHVTARKLPTIFTYNTIACCRADSF